MNRFTSASIRRVEITLLLALALTATFEAKADTPSTSNQPGGPIAQQDAFLSRLAELRAERGPKSYGRMTPEEQQAWIARIQGVAAKYEQFIAEHEAHPQLSLAMSDLAEAYGALRTRKGQPVGDSRKKSIEWYRKVISAEKEGSKLWQDARLRLAAKLRGENNKKALREARAITESIMQDSAGDSIAAAKAKAQLVYQCIRENDYQNAEMHCRELLSWKDEGKSRELQDCQSSAVNSLMQRMMYRDKMSLKDKKKWLDEFSTTAANQDWLKEEVAMAHRQFAVVEKMKPEANIEAKTSPFRTGFLIANVLAFAAIGLLVVRNRRRQRSDPKPIPSPSNA